MMQSGDTYVVHMLVMGKDIYVEVALAAWRSGHRNTPQEQKIRVRIPPGYKVYRENIALLLCVIYLTCVACVFTDK
jgi:hypothetical protein